MAVVRRRFGLETRDLREFIEPHAYKVREYADKLKKPEKEATILSLWDFVCRSFDYAYSDYHSLRAFGRLFTPFTYSTTDFWHFPSEMIAFYEDAQERGIRARGDCDDVTFLLTSLLLSAGIRAYATLGYFKDYLHGWTVLREGYVLEPTLDRAGDSPYSFKEKDPYKPLIRFDDKEVVFIGKMPLVLTKGKEEIKLGLIKEFWR